MDSHWPEWIRSASCLEIGHEAFFPEGNEDWATPRRVCGRCPVRLLCLDRIMRLEQGQDHKTRHGVVAGMSPMERKAYEPQWLIETEGAA